MYILWDVLVNVCENGRHRIVRLACVSSLFQVKLPGKVLAVMYEHRFGTVYVMPE